MPSSKSNNIIMFPEKD